MSFRSAIEDLVCHARHLGEVLELNQVAIKSELDAAERSGRAALSGLSRGGLTGDVVGISQGLSAVEDLVRAFKRVYADGSSLASPRAAQTQLIAAAPAAAPQPEARRARGALPRVLTTASVPDRSKGFDCRDPVPLDMAHAAVERGYVFVLRDLDNLSAAEIDGILDAGLALMLVKQPPATGGYTPSRGREDGAATLALARALDIPAGMSVFVWVEDTGANTKLDVGDYMERWCEALRAGGYVPGIYVNSSSFSAEELYRNFPFEHYWKARSLGSERSPRERGYQLSQGGSDTIAGRRVDVDFLHTEHLGGELRWLSGART